MSRVPTMDYLVALLRALLAVLVIIASSIQIQRSINSVEKNLHCSPWLRPLIHSNTPILDKAASLPSHWHHGAFMELYVRGYQDSNGDGYGDLRGLTKRLDYLQELGITGLWLLPITQSWDRDHGYAVTNYKAVEADYGKLEDLRVLVAEAHKRGIGVILDYVINHSSDQHHFFASARDDKGSPCRDLYVWRDPKPQGWWVYGQDPWYPSDIHLEVGQPVHSNSKALLEVPSKSFKFTGFYYSAFTGMMPDFNWKNGSVAEFHLDAMQFWLDAGVDGFRFDAAELLVENGPQQWRNQPESHEVFRKIRAWLQAKPNRYTVCEAASAWGAFQQSCGNAFDFGLPPVLFDAVNYPGPAVVRLLRDYISQLPPSPALFLSNHDAFTGYRAWTRVHSSLPRARLAAATYLLLPGTPFIYYGEEVGMGSWETPGCDPCLRSPMSWTATPAGFTTGVPFRGGAPNQATQNLEAERARPDSILAWYKALLRLRHWRPSLARGQMRVLDVGWGMVLAWRAELEEGEVTLVLINFGEPQAFTRLAGLVPGVEVVLLLGGPVEPRRVDEHGVLGITLPGQSVVVLGFGGLSS